MGMSGKRSPRFDAYRSSSPRASHIKSRVRSSDTRAELLLRKHLWRLGLRYRVSNSILPGKPDSEFRAVRMAVFVDGDYWHGRKWDSRRAKLLRGANASYWIAKIESNMARDLRKRKELRRLGWTVVRIWETDILRDPDAAAVKIERLFRRKRG
jgi:DNA mismatch endonuclease, patch repair protein